MLQPKVVADLELHEFGYDPIPLDPPFATFAADGQPDPASQRRRRSPTSRSRASRARTPTRCRASTRCSSRRRDFLRPLMLRPPPALGSKRPGDVLELLREAGRAAGMSRRDLHDLFRLMTMSVGDLLDDWFENDALKGAYASTGVVGVWAGPRTPGTAYNLLHHALGELDGVRAPGATCAAAWARSPRRSPPARAPPARRSAPARRSPRSTSSGGRVTGVTLVSGETLQRAARPVRRAPQAHGARPRRRRALPRRGRAGHAPLPHARRLGEDQRDPLRAAALRQRARRRRASSCCTPASPSARRSTYLERAWQDAKRGVPAEGPYIEVEVPDGDRPVADRRRHARC